MTRSLTLRREPLSELAPNDLATVGGAAGDIRAATPGCPTYPVFECLSWNPGCSVFCTG